MSEMQHVNMGWPEYPGISENDAKVFMQPQPNTIWCLELNGQLLAANPMLLWLWGLIRLNDAMFSISDLRDLHLFELYRRNFARIPVGLVENRDFFTKQAILIKRVASGHRTLPIPYAIFKAAMLASPAHRVIYEQATRANNEAEYTLKVQASEIYHATQLLEFRVHINAIEQNGTVTGNIIHYRPAGRTTELIKPIYQKIAARFGIVPYLLVQEQREVTTESGYVGEAVTETGNFLASLTAKALIDTDKSLREAATRETVTEDPFATFQRSATSETDDSWNALLELIEMTEAHSKESPYAMTGTIEEQKTGPLPTVTAEGEKDSATDWSPFLELIENVSNALGTMTFEPTTDSRDHNFIWDEWES